MKAIDMILNILTEPDLPCDGRECNAECPFRFGSEMNPNSRSLCISWGDDENARREAMLQMLFDAVDEAREEDGIPKKGEMWKRIGADDCTAVTILSVGGRLKDRQEVKFAASRVAFTVLLESFLKAYEKVKEPAKPSHTTPNHYRLDPEPIDVIRYQTNSWIGTPRHGKSNFVNCIIRHITSLEPDAKGVHTTCIWHKN